ncbi:cupin domain-containing protein [Veillonella parvula]|uniref:cupin domain-containing protein n=1 Tax=Veillonella parvula TaxID=29466 RepID=UPI002910D4B1|nr:cupin domain-containing protein [Veillonella parvula]MDU5559040.1 cupin domain-containing protein [Veillonella parvula]
MSDQRVFDMELVKVESLENAVKTPFYQTDSTGGSVWVIKPGQILPKHYHHHSDDICVFYPTPNTEVPFTKGQVIVSKKGECHGAKNTGTEDIVFVSIVAPVPADYDPVKTN